MAFQRIPLWLWVWPCRFWALTIAASASLLAGAVPSSKVLSFSPATRAFSSANLHGNGHVSIGGNQIFASSTDSGRTWSIGKPESFRNRPFVRFHGPDTGFALSNDSLLATLDGGKTWISRTASLPAHEALKSIYFLDGRTLFLSGSGGLILKSSDGGATWATLSAHTFPDVVNFDFPSPAIGYAACVSGSVLKTVDGGLSWSNLATGVVAAVRGVVFPSVDTGFGLAGSNLLKTTDGGATWVIRFLEQADFIALRRAGSRGLVALGATGHALRSDDGGVTWRPLAVPQGEVIADLAFRDSTAGYAGGQNGTVLRTMDGGASWTEVWSPPMGLTRQPLTQAAFSDADHGWVLGSHELFRTTDGGASWTRQNPDTHREMYAIQALDPNTAFIIGQNSLVLKTTDGGAHWVAKDPATGGHLYGLSFLDANNGWVVGSEEFIIRTRDGGDSWSIQSKDGIRTLFDVLAVDSTNVFIGGIDRSANNPHAIGLVLKTEDAGISWVPIEKRYGLDNRNPVNGIGMLRSDALFSTTTSCQHPPPGVCFASEISAVWKSDKGGSPWQPVRKSDQDVYVDTKCILSSACFALTRDGNLDFTTDGSNWDRVDLGIPLNGMHFPSASVGYAVGDSGAIVKVTSEIPIGARPARSVLARFTCAIRDGVLGIDLSSAAAIRVCIIGVDGSLLGDLAEVRMPAGPHHIALPPTKGLGVRFVQVQIGSRTHVLRWVDLVGG
jgi:photosystem II stability/assembly factor-like uncharacterized protein